MISLMLALLLALLISFPCICVFLNIQFEKPDSFLCHMLHSTIFFSSFEGCRMISITYVDEILSSTSIKCWFPYLMRTDNKIWSTVIATCLKLIQWSFYRHLPLSFPLPHIYVRACPCVGTERYSNLHRWMCVYHVNAPYSCSCVE